MIKLIVLVLIIFAMFTEQATKNQYGSQFQKQMIPYIKGILQDAYKLHAEDIKQNIAFIQKNLYQLSPEQYNIIIDIGDTNTFSPYQSNQWWVNLFQPNKYKALWNYIIQKVPHTYSLTQYIDLIFDTKSEYVFGSGFNEQDKRVIQNLMSFILKQHNAADKRIFQLKKQLTKYFKNQNWNVLNTPIFLGRAKFCAKDKKYFVRNGWTDDYIVYLS